jgi:sugar-specific transcriptional regulator TrmB
LRGVNLAGEDAVTEALRKALDLTLYEAKLYIALLQGAKDPKEASVMSGVPLPRIYDIVRVLESKGMVYREPNGWYKAVSPQSLAAMSIVKVEEDMRRKVKEIENAVKMLEKYEKPSQRSATIVKGFLNMISAAVDYFKGSTTVYVTVAYVLTSTEQLSKLLSSLLTYVTEVRVLAGLTSLQVPQIPGVKVWDGVNGIYLDSLVSKSAIMVILRDPTADEPVSLLVNDQLQAGFSFKSLSAIWQAKEQANGSTIEDL